MKAYLHSARIAPKKANLIARMVRGMDVPSAVEALRRTDKKAARMIETLLRSAIANASHNDKQDPQTMVIKEIIVNQGTAYRRGMPKARGQTRPYKKFLTHISLVLGYADVEEGKAEKKERKEKGGTKAKESSQKAKKPVKDMGSSKIEKIKTTPVSSQSSSSSAS